MEPNRKILGVMNMMHEYLKKETGSNDKGMMNVMNEMKTKRKSHKNEMK